MRAVSSKTVIEISFSLRRSGSKKHRVFPLPVPISKTTSWPHNTTAAASSCHLNGWTLRVLYDCSEIIWRSSSSSRYCLTFDCTGAIFFEVEVKIWVLFGFVEENVVKMS